MIEFDDSRYCKKKDGTVYLTYEEIDSLTETLILDYDSTLLEAPRAIEYDDFLEGYLGVNLLYQDLYTPNGETILGCAVFNKQRIPVYDKENRCKSYIECEPRTIIIDNSVVSGTRVIQEPITGLHEGGHIWFHSYQLTDMEGQLSIKEYQSSICCRKTDIDISDVLEKFRPSSAEMWREWQANVFAVTIALPRKSLDIAVRELFAKHGVDTSALIVDADRGTRYLAEQVIPEELKEIYGISKQAIGYRLKKTGFYTTKIKYEEEHRQMSFFDLIK